MTNSDFKHGSLLGAALLIAGSCIGAGMLALPIVTGMAGFIPAFVAFLIAWAYMTATGLLLVEVNGWFPGEVNLITMVEKALGTPGKVIAWVTYLFLFYALLIAYISAIGGITSTFFKVGFSISSPPWVGSLFFVLLFGGVILFGTRRVDHWNRFLMAGKIVCFLSLVVSGFFFFNSSRLLQFSPTYIFASFPILIISFGFHNMVPSLSAYFKGDIRRLRTAVIAGSLFSLLVYLIWEFIVLGALPITGPWGVFESAQHGRDAAQALTGSLGLSYLSNFASGLAFFAILTSFLAQALALVHFWADGLKVSYAKKESIPLSLLALVPPLLFALIYPALFLKALSFAGGFCAVILFGILPVLMVWRGRHQKWNFAYQVKGGKTFLVAVFLLSLFIIFIQYSSMSGWTIFPKP